ncbi:hypothetical protein R6Q59_023281 [Mikania micrantha]
MCRKCVVNRYFLIFLTHFIVNNENNLVDVKPKSRLSTNDPFVLASQAEQVFYTPYPAIKRDTKDLWAVVKTKARHIYEVTEPEAVRNIEEHGFLQIDERFEQPNENDTSSSESIEEREYEDEEETSNDDDEMIFSDHSSDEDELDC